MQPRRPRLLVELRKSGEQYSVHFSSIHSLSHVWLFVTPWTAAWRASLSITNSWGLLKLMSIESVIPSNHLILCHPLILPLSIFPSIRVFWNESTRHIRWPKYWSFHFNISPSNEYSGLIFFRIDWFDLFIYDEVYEPHGNQKPAKDSFNVDLFSLVKWPLF